MWAAYKGRVEVTELLLQHGANTNTTGQVTHTRAHTQLDPSWNDLSLRPPVPVPVLHSTVCIPSSGLPVVDTLKSSNFCYKTEPKSTVLIR